MTNKIITVYRMNEDKTIKTTVSDWDWNFYDVSVAPTLTNEEVKDLETKAFKNGSYDLKKACTTKKNEVELTLLKKIKNW